MNRGKPALNASAITFEGRLFQNQNLRSINDMSQASYTVIPTVPAITTLG